MTGRAILSKKYRLRQKYPPTSPKRVGTPLYKGEADGEVLAKDLPRDLPREPPSLTPNPSPEGKGNKEGGKRRGEKWGEILGRCLGRYLGRCENETSPQETPCTSAFQKVWGGMEVFFEKKKKGKRKKAKNESYAFG